MIALAWSAHRVVDAAYRELSRPVDVTTPIAVRVLGSLPEVVVLVLVTWVLGQILGAMAARRIVLVGTSIGRRPESRAGRVRPSPAPAAGPVHRPGAGPARGPRPDGRGDLLDVGSGPDRHRRIGRRDRGDRYVSLFVGLWLGGLVLVSMVCAWRAAAWTLDAEQRTFGVTPDDPTG